MKICVASLVVGLALAWAAPCSATPDFPAVVVQYFSLPAITIDPPQGCKLCHPNDSGGTTLSPFGTLLQQYGASPYNPSSLEGALAQLKLDEPQLIEDIKAGRDPNSDTSGSNVHSPQYGCGLGPGPSPGPVSPAALVSAALLASMRRCRRRVFPSSCGKLRRRF